MSSPESNTRNLRREMEGGISARRMGTDSAVGDGSGPAEELRRRKHRHKHSTSMHAGAGTAGFSRAPLRTVSSKKLVKGLNASASVPLMTSSDPYEVIPPMMGAASPIRTTLKGAKADVEAGLHKDSLLRKYSKRHMQGGAGGGMRRAQTMARMRAVAEDEAAAGDTDATEGGASPITAIRAKALADAREATSKKNVIGGSLRAWLAMQEEQREEFASAALENELKLQRAREFSKDFGRPNQFLTAVAFDVLDSMSAHFGKNTKVIKAVQRVLRESVFINAAELKERLRAYDPAGGREKVEVYYEQLAYFQRHGELTKETADLKVRIAQLERQITETMATLDRERVRVRAAAKEEIATSAAAHEAVALDLREKIRFAKKELEEYKHQQAKRSARDVMLDALMKIGIQDREVALMDCIEQAPSTWTGIGTHLLKNSPTATAVMMCKEAINDRPDAKYEDFLELLTGILDGERVGAEEGMRGKLYGTIVMGADKDRQAVLDSLMALCQTREKQALVRFICKLDARQDWMYMGRNVDAAKAFGAAARRSTDGDDPPPQLRLPMRSPGPLRSPKPQMGQKSFWGPGSPDGTTETHSAGPGPAVGDGTINWASLLGSLQKDEEASLLDALLNLQSKEDAADMWMTRHVEKFATLEWEAKTEILKAIFDAIPPKRKAIILPLILGDDAEELGLLMKKKSPEGGAGDDTEDTDSKAGDDEEGKEEDGGQLAKKLARAKRKALKFRVPLPFARFLRRPPRNVAKIKLKLGQVMTVVYDCIEKKMKLDEVDDREGNHRQSMCDFLRDFLLHKYGLPSIVDGNLFAICEWLVKKKKHPRLQLFAVMCGVVDEERYTPRFADVVLNLYRSMFPRFTQSTLRMRKVGQCIVDLDTCLESLDTVFPKRPINFAIDQIELRGGKRKELIAAVRASAMSFAAFKAQIAEQKLSEEADDGLGDTDTKDGDEGGSVPKIMGHFTEKDDVVDVDKVVEMAMAMWSKQLEEDNAGMRRMYHEYDEDKNGVLSLGEFKTLLAACCPEPVDPKRALDLFKEVSTYDGPQSGDTVSVDAFVVLCTKYGITPPSVGDGEGSADGSVDGDVVPVPAS